MSTASAPRATIAAVISLALFAGCHHSALPTGRSDEGLCTPLPAVPRRIWRLSPKQISSSMRDLLGLASAPAVNALGGQIPDALVDNDALTVDAALAFTLDATIDQALADAAARIPTLAACQPNEDEDACAARFARSFGQRAFRRPLDDDEVADLLTVYADGRQQDFDTGISTMISALFHAPSFLFRRELGSSADAITTTLTPYEIASQISYAFLDTTPDQALLDAAASGSLATADGTTAEVDRLLASDAARANVTRIVANWLELPLLGAGVEKDAALGVDPADQPSIRADLTTSALLFVDDTLWGGTGALTGLVTSDRLFMNQRLAALYGLPFAGPSPTDFVAVPAPAGQAAGVLTQPAMLWLQSSDPAGGATASILHRATFVRDDVVCARTLPEPFDLEAAASARAASASEIARSDYRLATAPCAGCHAQIDPYGRVLEGFDAIGRARTTADGQPVDAAGDFSRAPPLAGRITGPVALAQAIAATGQVAGCAAQKLAGHAIGRAIGASTCEVRQVRDGFVRDGGTIQALIEQLANAPFARTRAVTAP